MNHCSLCIDCMSVLGSNPEGIRTGCGQVQEYADRLRTRGGVLRCCLDGGARLKPPNPYPSLRVILAEKGTHY